MASSDTGGVKPFGIARRMARENERLIGMTDEERAWRNQYLKDQILHHDEPVIDDGQAFRQNLNPIRRFYRAPLDKFEDMLVKPLGSKWALTVRFMTGKFFIGVGLTYATYYYFKYNQNTWMRKSGWRVIHSRKPVLPGDPGYPQVSDRTKPSDYASRGFKDSPI
ncbi:uncharacterized protein LOC124180830 [Neodiprion fabricii]|uniref:uncharacterized protein LOC124180830 n=1 Tax=Neodiprion fabricii TaxID=2872261 RepID=UPI001ED8ED81|nr:uncharacterized protein LOC124180830 [Neodiprion fabricii]XP_046422629.1 uncharacterized protein LOC124180830 [Neodiprion fabricii]XP_046422631.1 uncharacterized protein LOC124180830 [Neodiprion fabricii]